MDSTTSNNTSVIDSLIENIAGMQLLQESKEKTPKNKIYTKKSIAQLLKKYSQNTDNYQTHVSFVGGKYNIPNEDMLTFLKEYYFAIKDNVENLFLVEKVGEKFCYFQDLDFAENNESENTDLLQQIISITRECITEFFETTDNATEFIVSKRMWKYHINYPNLVVNSDTASNFTNLIISKLKKSFSEDQLKCIDTSVYRTGLRLLGSRKSDRLEKDKHDSAFESVYKLYDLSKKEYILSYDFDLFLKTIVRVFDNQISFTPVKVQSVASISSASTSVSSTKVKVKGQVPQEIIQNITDLLAELKSQNDSLSMFDLTLEKIVYAQNKTGHMCYYLSIKDRFCPFKEREHIRDSNPIYLELNRKGLVTRCFDEECLKKVYPKTPIELNETFQQDYPLLYKSLFISDWNKEVEVDLPTQKLLENSLSCTHYNIAKVLYHLYKNSFRVDEIRNTEWYEYKEHRWQKSYSMYINVSESLPKYYRSIKTKQVESIEDISDTEGKQKNLLNDRVDKIISKLENVSFKKDILNDAKYLFYNIDPQFAFKLNSNPFLIGFKNGVYDLETQSFRSGRLDDNITFTTGYDYIPYDSENETTKEIYTFLSQILTNTAVREYTLKTLAKSIEGVPDEKFYIWTGLSGANGKSTLVNFLEMTLGDYSTSLDVSILTNKRPNSSSATPDIVEMRGKRSIFFQEPESNDKLHVGILKQFTGNDIIKCRELFKSPISFRSMASFVMCCNELPKVSSMDGGTWRRIRVVEFKSRFCDNPTKPNEFKIDPSLKYKLKMWRPYFMSILLHYYSKVKTEGIEEPLEVYESTANYKTDNDKYNDFFLENIVEDTESFMTYSELYMSFEDWWKTNFSAEKLPSKQEFKRVLRNKFGEELEMTIENKKFKGFHLRLKTDEYEKELSDNLE